MPRSSQDQVWLPQQTSQDPKPSDTKLPWLCPQPLPALPPGITALCQDGCPVLLPFTSHTWSPAGEGSWLLNQLSFSTLTSFQVLSCRQNHVHILPGLQCTCPLYSSSLGSGWVSPRSRHHPDSFSLNDPELGLVSEVVDETALNQGLEVEASSASSLALLKHSPFTPEDLLLGSLSATESCRPSSCK